MDKSFLLRVNNSLKKIKTQLLLNDSIRQKLYYETIDETTPVPVIDQVKDHVYLQPVITVETMEPFNKQNYITITIPEGDKHNNKMEYVVRVIVMSEKKSWNLNGDVRPLLISQEIINILDGYKLDFSNTLEFTNIVETVTSKDVYGYSILFGVVDGISDVDEK